MSVVIMLALSFETTHPPLSMNMARGSRERVEGSLASGSLWGFAVVVRSDYFLPDFLMPCWPVLRGPFLPLAASIMSFLALASTKRISTRNRVLWSERETYQP